VGSGFVWFVKGVRTGEFLLMVNKSLLLFWAENTVFRLLILLDLGIRIGWLIP
jgi:hypothetical protein